MFDNLLFFSSKEKYEMIERGKKFFIKIFIWKKCQLFYLKGSINKFICLANEF